VARGRARRVDDHDGKGLRVTGVRAAIFPGQGSQRPGMEQLLERYRPDLLEALVEAVGVDDVFMRLEESTRFLQPALVCASLAGWKRYREEGFEEPTFLCGHSLGELSALIAAGSLGEDEGLRLVALRGELMERAADQQGDGAMVAYMGHGVRALAARAEELGLVVANDNSPTQIVLSGSRPALETATAEASDAGLIAAPLPIRGAFHHPDLEPIVAPFREALDQIRFAPARITVLSSMTARPFQDPQRELADALVHPVRWRQTIEELHRCGVRSFVEVGPGRVLSRMVGRMLRGVEAQTLDSPEGAVV